MPCGRVCMCEACVKYVGSVCGGVWCYVAVCVCVRRVLYMLGVCVVVCGGV